MDRKIKEIYNKNKNTIDILESGDTIVLSMNGVDGFTLPYEVDELVPIIVEHSLVKGISILISYVVYIRRMRGISN